MSYMIKPYDGFYMNTKTEKNEDMKKIDDNLYLISEFI